jgi:hypothetical protein
MGKSVGVDTATRRLSAAGVEAGCLCIMDGIAAGR